MSIKYKIFRKIIKNEFLAYYLINLYQNIRYYIYKYIFIREKYCKLHIKFITKKLYKINDGCTEIFIYSPFRILFYSRGILNRISEVSRSYNIYDNNISLKGKIVFDIGANIGEFSLYCLERGAIVYSIEADKNVIPALNANLAKWIDKNKAKICNFAATNKNGVDKFYYKSHEADSTIIRPNNIEGYIETNSNCMRLDKFIIDYQIDEVELIKCDAEGGEPEVVDGCQMAIRRVKRFSFDCGPERNGYKTINEVVNTLEANDFTILTNPALMGRSLVYAINNNFKGI